MPTDASAAITLALPKGGQPPLNSKSDEPDFQTKATGRFKSEATAHAALANAIKLQDVSASDYDTVFYPGGHGPLWNLADDRISIALIEAMDAAGKLVAAVCHAPAVFPHTENSNGSSLVHGKAVIGLSQPEEQAVQPSEIVSFLLEDEPKAKGANCSKAEDWRPYAITDGNLISGQNSASPELVAKAVLEKLRYLETTDRRRLVADSQARNIE